MPKCSLQWSPVQSLGNHPSVFAPSGPVGNSKANNKWKSALDKPQSSTPQFCHSINQWHFWVPHTFLACFPSWKVEEINWRRLVYTCAVTKHLGYLALMVFSRNLPLHTLFCFGTPIKLKILVYHPKSTFHNDSHEYILSIINSQMSLISILLLFLPGVWIALAYSRGL